MTENVQNTTPAPRKSRKDIPLGNRFAGLPIFGTDGAPSFARDDVLTLTEVALLAGRSKLTASKYLKNAEGGAVEAVCLIPSASVGRPSPAYARADVERALGMVDTREAADAIMADVAAALDSADSEVAGSAGE